MAYDPPSGAAVNINFSGSYTTPDGGHINIYFGSVINVFPNELEILIEPDQCLVTIGDTVNILPDEFQIIIVLDVIMRMALVLKPSVGVVQIDDSDVGKGLKPVVFLNGNPVHRVDNEGTPIVMTANGYKTLSDDEELII